jgi:hypothetical protein
MRGWSTGIIEDRLRVLQRYRSWTSPAHAIASASQRYAEDLWRDQPLEVWIEKDALLGVIEPVCEEYVVPHLAHRGSPSQTVIYEAAKRLLAIIGEGRTPRILHLTDHDPTGIDMTRDLTERLAKYAGQEIEVKRIALTMDQVRELNPPPNFVKETDTRTSGYQQQFGTDECWELDALSPTVIADLIRDELMRVLNLVKWNAAQRKEDRNRNLLKKVAQNWSKVEKALRGKKQ